MDKQITHIYAIQRQQRRRLNRSKQAPRIGHGNERTSERTINMTHIGICLVRGYAVNIGLVFGISFATRVVVHVCDYYIRCTPPIEANVDHIRVWLSAWFVSPSWNWLPSTFASLVQSLMCVCCCAVVFFIIFRHRCWLNNRNKPRTHLLSLASKHTTSVCCCVFYTYTWLCACIVITQCKKVQPSWILQNNTRYSMRNYNDDVVMTCQIII